MKQTLGMRMGQTLAMTPALQQAIKLLQMSTLDLNLEIEAALESNLLLERDEDAPPPAEQQAETREDTGDDIPEEPPLDYDWQDVYGNSSASDVADAVERYEYQQANLYTAANLHDHLHEQADLEPLDDRQRLALEYMIDAIDERGYIPDWPVLGAEIRDETELTEGAVEAVVRTLHQFDPPGIGARNLRECLLIQLDQRATQRGTDVLARELVESHLAELAQLEPARLARTTGHDASDIETAMRLIRSLQPHPGKAYGEQGVEYIAPDVYVHKVGTRWQVSLNPQVNPKLKINTEYQALIKRADTSPDQVLLKQHLQEARHLLHNLRSRNETLIRVAQEIVDRQRGFLEYGPEAMKPMVLRDIAERLGLHESTISRATARKYMQTPRGLFELKYFFSSAVGTTEGGTCSATAIQAMLKRLVSEEDPKRPLSDSRLTRLLLDQGIQVARRTVAKYREALDIPPSHERKRMASHPAAAH